MDDLHGEDLRQPVEQRTRLGRSYIRLLAPLGLVVAVVAFGLYGRTTPASDTPAPSDSQAIAVIPEQAPTPHVVALFGPPAISADLVSSAIAASGRRLFYTVNGQMLLSVSLAAGTGGPQLLNWAGRCRSIDGIAAAGETLLFVESKRGDPTGSECSTSSQVSWAVFAYDLVSHTERTLVTGVTSISHFDRASPPVHLAMSGDEFAIEHPMPQSPGIGTPVATAGYQIDVRSLADGSLRWTAAVPAPVRSLMLGGDRLAVLVSTTSLPQLYLVERTKPAPRLVASMTTGSSLSRDGRYLVWDSAQHRTPDGHPSLSLLDIDTGRQRDLGAAVAPPGFPAVDPAIASTPDGPVVAWYCVRPEGWVGVRFVDPAHPDGAWLDTPIVPSWMSVQNDNLLWLEPPASNGQLTARLAALSPAPVDVAPVGSDPMLK